MLNKKQRIENFNNYIFSNNFGIRTWTTLFTYRENYNFICETINLYSKLLIQTNTQYNSHDIRIKQQICLDIISKLSVLIESLIILINALSRPYASVPENITKYKIEKIYSIITELRSNHLSFNIRRALGLCKISNMTELSTQQRNVIAKAYTETVKVVISKLANLINFYDDFRVVYGKTKHGLTYYLGHIEKSSQKDVFHNSLLLCTDKKTEFDIKNKKIPSNFLVKQSKKNNSFNFLTYVKFNVILEKRINSVLDDLRFLVDYLCLNHLTNAINCGQPYLPFTEQNKIIKINFPEIVFNSVLIEEDFHVMFKDLLNEMNFAIPDLSTPVKTTSDINNLLNKAGIANVLIAMHN